MRHTEFILEKRQKEDLNLLKKFKSLANDYLSMNNIERRQIADRLAQAERKITRRTVESVTGAGSIASVAGNVGAGGMQRRNPDGTAVNALDSDTPLMGKKRTKKKKTKEV